MPSPLADARNELLNNLLHTIGRVVLHLTGDSPLSRGERRQAAELLKQLLATLEER